MVKTMAIAAGVAAALAVAALLVLPAAGGLSPTLSKPTVATCRQHVAAHPRQPHTVSVGWIWSSGRFGWGCKYAYPDGSTGTLVVGS